MSNIKIERLNDAIQEEISKILMTEIKDEEIHFVTITDCSVASDLSVCKVYFTVLDITKKDTVLQALQGAASFIRGKLSERLTVRHTPELRFIYDESIAYGEHIDQLIEQLHEDTDEL